MPQNDTDTRAGAEWAMARVMAEVHKMGLLPLILIAGNETDPYVLFPCGHCREEVVWALLERIVDDRRAAARTKEN